MPAHKISIGRIVLFPFWPIICLLICITLHFYRYYSNNPRSHEIAQYSGHTFKLLLTPEEGSFFDPPQIVGIDSFGNYHINGEPISGKDLSSLLAKLAELQPIEHRGFRLKIHENQTVQQVVNLLDIFAKASVELKRDYKSKYGAEGSSIYPKNWYHCTTLKPYDPPPEPLPQEMLPPK